MLQKPTPTFNGAAANEVPSERVSVTRIVAYVPDLMDRSKVAGAPGDVSFVDDIAELSAAAQDADVVVVDLGRPGVLDVLPSIHARIVGFARHTQPELLAAARRAGCADALARSAFFPRINELLG